MTDTITLREAAARVGVCRSTLSRAIDAGTIPVPKLQIGKSVRLSRARFEQWVSGDVPPSPEQGSAAPPAAAPPSPQ